MSADRWSNCPRCDKKAAQKVKEAQGQVREAYGVVSVNVFDEMRRQVDELVAQYIKRQDDETQFTLREDYEFWGVDYDGTLHIRYSCGCNDCGFSFNFEKNIPILELQND